MGHRGEGWDTEERDGTQRRGMEEAEARGAHLHVAVTWRKTKEMTEQGQRRREIESSDGATERRRGRDLHPLEARIFSQRSRLSFQSPNLCQGLVPIEHAFLCTAPTLHISLCRLVCSARKGVLSVSCRFWSIVGV